MDIYDYVNEATVSDVARKQKSITRLFPTFHDRVRKVAQKGGSHLKSMTEDTWKWKVHSGTKDDVWYDVVLHFKNIQQTVRKLAIDRRLWTKDKKHVDLNKLAKKFLQVADIQTDCSCPSDSYHGFEWIKSQDKYDAQYGDKEDRAPNIKNPKRYGCLCKHGSAMLKVLPFNYWSTAARWLKKYHSETIANAEQFARKQSGMFQKAGDELSRRKEDTELKKVSMKPQEPQKPPVEPPEPPEDEEGPEQSEEEPRKPTEPPEASEAPSTENEEEAGGNEEDTDIPPNEDQPSEEQEAPLPNKPPQGDEVNPTEEDGEEQPIGPLGSGGKRKPMKPPVRRIKGQRRREDVEDQSKLPAKDNPFGKDVTKRK